ncbi:MAG: DUF4340 domain-containing protein [Phycisphaerae bacterium]
MVDSLVTKMADLSYTLSFKPGDADRPGDDLTGLDAPTRVKATDATGKSWVLKLGRGLPTGRQAYAQREADDTIYIVQAELREWLDRDLIEFRDKRIADLALEDVTRIEVSGADPYVLAKSNDGWTVESPTRGRADKTAVENMLRALYGTFATTFIDAGPANLAAYGLTRPSLKMVIHAEKRTLRPASQPAGTQPAAPQYDVKPYTIAFSLGATTNDKRFGKFDDGAATPTVFQILESPMASIAPPLINLRDKAVTRFAAGKIQKVALSGPAGSAELVRKDGAWTFASGAPTAATAAESIAVEDLLKSLRELTATGFETDDPLKDFGFAKPRVALTLTEEGTVEPIRLQVGGVTTSGTGAYVRNEGESFVAVVKAEAIDALAVTPLTFAARDVLRFDRSQAVKMDFVQESRRFALASQSGKWRFTAPITGDADSSAIINVLADLSSLRARRMVGTKAELAKFGLTNPAVVATLTIQPPAAPSPTTSASQPASAPAQPLPPAQTIVVRAARSGGNSYVYVDGAELIAEVDGRIVDDLQAELLDKHVLVFPASTVQSLTISRSAGKMTFERKGGDWTLAGEASFPVDVAKLNPLADTVAGLKTDRYAAYQATDLKPFGLDAPALSIAAKLEGGTTHELRIAGGGPPSDSAGRRYATVMGSGRVFTLSKDDVAKFDQDVKFFRRP